MPVNDDVPVTRSVANGSTTVFPYHFRILQASDMEVLLGDTVISPSLYIVTNVGLDSGDVVMLTPPEIDTVVIRRRKPLLAQTSLYQPNEAYPAERITTDFDKVLMSIQCLWEELGRCAKIRPSSPLSASDVQIEDPVVGHFARAKDSGGIDWAAVTSTGQLAVPVTVTDGGTGSNNPTDARAALGAVGLTGSETINGVKTFSSRPVLAGGGAQFPDPPVLSANARTFDDYLEGDGVVTLGGTATYTTRICKFTKIGRHVFVYIDITVATIGTGSTSRITFTGMPPIAAGATTVGAVHWGGTSANYSTLLAVATPNSSEIVMVGATSAANATEEVTPFQNGTFVRFSLSYISATA